MQHLHARVIFSDEWQTRPVTVSADTEQVTVSLSAIGIDEVRAITAEAYRRPTTGVAKLIVIRAGTITIEAQHAFLKTLEEPPGDTSLLLLVPIATTLLPTVRSRVQIEVDQTRTSSTTFTTWVNSPVADRISQIEAAAKGKDDAFFASMHEGLRDYLSLHRSRLDSRTVATAQYVLIHLRTRGASNKMLLEELALSLPVSSQ